MSREILFKAKRVDNGEWVEGLLYKELNNFYGKSLFNIQRINKFGIPIAVYEIDPETVGQYTGLTDKNGNRIFEGDIVKCIFITQYKESEFISEVEFLDGSWFVHESEDCDIYLYNYETEGVSSLSEIEVIGNRLDNPELLSER